jgi:hypothetical protein
MISAVDDEAQEFWKRRGFIPSRMDPLIPFRSIADIAATMTRLSSGAPEQQSR